MSSRHRLTSFGDVEHTNFLSEDIGALYLSNSYTDVTLIVADQRFNGHKIILAARSQYFRALLFGGLKESSQQEIELKGASVPAFKGLFKYIYTGHMSLANQREEVIVDILGLAHQYGFVELESAISDYLKKILSIKNFCFIFDAARLYQIEFLKKWCYQYVNKYAAEIIHHDSFLQLSPTALNELISRDSFYAPEIDIFLAVQEWIKANPDVDAKEILAQVRLSLISLTDLLNVVRPTRLVSSEAILDAITAIMDKSSDLAYRGQMLVDQNIALAAYGAEVLQGEMRSYLLDGNCYNYDMERGYTRHAITDTQEHGILIKLGTQCIINHIKMLLWDRDLRSYSYYIEVSMDQKHWVFHVVSFEAYYRNHSEKLSEGFIVPTRNVATMKFGATVTEGVSRIRNALLNGDTSDYDWDSGYTCHQLGSGSILIQLGQPYIIDSMRLLLWDCDKRSYSYYIEVSSNYLTWDLVVDKTKELCRSWQILRFHPARPVVFIRIVGTHNTANEVFHCVHFECPSQVEDKAQKSPMNRGKHLTINSTETDKIDQDDGDSTDDSVIIAAVL
uniref:BTB/POZ domain-containing protein 9 isoform X2 n=1 Tax=Vespula vulgaris TaxID=7454 RepID=UPI00223AEE88|nr:BTB/POZ domain-containing protein 9 isoform X2 [Vespula vulgaris]